MRGEILYKAGHYKEAFQHFALYCHHMTNFNMTQYNIAIRHAVTHLLNLGFLLDLDQKPSTPRPESPSQTLSAWLHVTNNCNLRCSYCYIEKSAEQMTEETSLRAIDAVIRSKATWGLPITIPVALAAIIWLSISKVESQCVRWISNDL